MENEASSETSALGASAGGSLSNNEGARQANAPQDEAKVKAQEREDELVIRQLRARDQAVRVHEAAHAAEGGQYAGSPSLQFTRGPDGVN